MNTENLSPEAKQILALARQESKSLQHFYLALEHVFIFPANANCDNTNFAVIDSLAAF
jgi:hypothetical protein